MLGQCVSLKVGSWCKWMGPTPEEEGPGRFSIFCYVKCTQELHVLLWLNRWYSWRDCWIFPYSYLAAYIRISYIRPFLTLVYLVDLLSILQAQLQLLYSNKQNCYNVWCFCSVHNVVCACVGISLSIGETMWRINHWLHSGPWIMRFGPERGKVCPF